MSTIDFNTPTVTDNYSTAFVPNLNNNFKSLGFLLDPLYVTAITNPITGMQRVNSVTKLIEFFNGTSWVERVMDYARLSGAGGSGPIAFTQAVNSSVGFNGILGGTTPAAATVTLLTSTGNIFAQGFMSISHATALESDLFFNNTNLNRFYLSAQSDGSALNFAYCDNTGTYAGIALSIARATGRVTMNNGVDVSGGVGNTFTTIGSTGVVSLIDTGANGANLKWTGNGATTPSKYIRVVAGNMEWINSAYSAVIATLTDAGAFTAAGIVKGTGGLDAGSNSIINVGNIFGPAASGAYTIGAEPAGTFSNGAFVQVYGSTHANTGRLILNAGTATGLIDFTINNVSKLTLNSNGTLNAKGGAYTAAVAVAFSATPTFDLKASNFQVFGNLTANVTAVTLTNPVEGQLVTIRLRQDATGGRTFTTGNMGATNAPAVSGSVNTGANKTTMMTVAYNATDARYDVMYSQVN